MIWLYYNAGTLRGLSSIAKYSSLVNLAFTFGLAILLIFISFDMANKLEWSYVIATFIICVISFFWLEGEVKLTKIKSYAKLNNRDLLNTSLPMLSASAITIINGWSDTLILGMLTNNEQVGIFQILLKMAGIINIVLFSVNSISAPKFAHLYVNNQSKLQSYVYSSTKLIVITVFPILILLLIAYQPIIDILGGSFNSTDYFSAFAFLCFGQLFNAFCGSGGQLLSMTGFQTLNRNIIMFSTVISIVFNFLIIPYYGILGAAFSNMIGLVLRNLLYVIYTNSKLKINTVYNPMHDIIRKLGKSKMMKYE
ncbi:MAG: oligosaccharide flippase family protein [Cyclobacteriaceae bacterium]|nr:oligosaccharide flippase family protein [Cyclobacteriaceae bacterium]